MLAANSTILQYEKPYIVPAREQNETNSQYGLRVERNFYRRYGPYLLMNNVKFQEPSENETPWRVDLRLYQIPLADIKFSISQIMQTASEEQWKNGIFIVIDSQWHTIGVYANMRALSRDAFKVDEAVRLIKNLN